MTGSACADRMPVMRDDIDQIMERASQVLAGMDYLECEALCVQALALARQRRDWDYYARILLPLQESRRQRRIIAAAGVVRLGTSETPPDAAASLLEKFDSGCIVLTHPLNALDAAALQTEARTRRRHIEVLFADNPANAATWTLRSFNGTQVSLTTPAPPADWRDRWLTPDEQRTMAAPVVLPGTPQEEIVTTTPTTPADWFLVAMEALGDAALARVDASLESEARLKALETCLEAVTDHEILHQRLADTARTIPS